MNQMQRFRLASEFLTRKFGESGVLVNLETDRIYELNETGYRITELLAGEASVDELVALLEQEYAADPVELRRDVEATIGELLDAALIVAC